MEQKDEQGGAKQGSGPKVSRRLSRSAPPVDDAVIKAVKVGLHGKLRRLDLTESWIERCEDDLVGQGLAEYARARSRGVEITNPGGWLVHTGYRRAIDQLRREGHEIYGEGAEAILSAAPDPASATDDEAIGRIEVEQLHEAVAELSDQQRQALSLYFFEEMSTRAAADALRVSEPTFRRRRDAAIQAIRERLGIEPEQGDALAVEIGLAAWLSLAAGAARPTIADYAIAASESVRSSVGTATGRIRDLFARFLSSGGGEGASGATVGAAARVTGVCATAVVACVASGVVGPGVGGVDVLGGGGHGSDGRPAPLKREQVLSREEISAPAPRSSNSGEVHRGEHAAGGAKPGSSERPERGGRAKRAERAASSQFGIEPEATPESPAPEVAPPPPSTSPSSGGGTSPTRSANEQFGLP